MILISQRNPEWTDIKLGQSQRTIGSDGCLITSISMLSDWYGDYKKPSWMTKYLKFTKGGLLLWPSITESNLPMKFVFRHYGYNENAIANAISGKTTSCVLQIRNIHWVAATKKIGPYYWVYDPWPVPNGRKSLIHKSIVTGSATLDQK